MAVVAFAAWLAINGAWLSSTYTAAAAYQAAFILAGLWLGMRADKVGLTTLAWAVGAFAAVLALWAVWQRHGGTGRAHALFETPATLTSAVNVVLVPTLALLAWRPASAIRFLLAVLLCAAVIGAQSRGGWLGMASGALVCAIVARRAGMPLRARDLVLPAAAVAGGWLLIQLVALADPSGWVLGSGASTDGTTDRVASEVFFSANAAISSWARVGLYELAIDALTTERILTGIGYLNFYHVFMSRAHEIPSYAESSVTYFVHNDYLQIFLELGVPGLVGMLGITALPVWQAWRAAPLLRSRPDRAIALAAAVAALASMAVHAMVDFPFYVPVCILLYGLVLGVLSTMLEETVPERARPAPTASSIRRAGAAAALTVLAWLLAMPLAAETAAKQANRRWAEGRVQPAAFWFEVARRFEPRDWRYHWYAGQFWQAIAAEHDNTDAAVKADAAFAAGHQANAHHVANIASRIELHLVHRSLFPSPVPHAVLMQWAGTAVKLAPHDRRVSALRNLVMRGGYAHKR